MVNTFCLFLISQFCEALVSLQAPMIAQHDYGYGPLQWINMSVPLFLNRFKEGLINAQCCVGKKTSLSLLYRFFLFGFLFTFYFFFRFSDSWEGLQMIDLLLWHFLQ